MTEPLTRREFVAGAAALAVPAAAGQNEPTLKVGVIGCGGRGRGATENVLESAPNVQIVAMGDMFKDHLDAARKTVADWTQKNKHPGFKVDDDHAFTGFDAYKRVLDSGVDMVILATPPGFRPLHFAAAIDAGKHVFFEKPVAVDSAGIRKVIEYGIKAAQRKLAVVTGTQRRHEKCYLDMVRRIREGAIGEIRAARAYWNGGGVWDPKPRKPEWTDMEYQLRNWYYYDWLCGDHIVEQHVHNLDVVNWVLQKHPLRAVAVGGRQVRTDPEYGHIFDHFGVDYEYEGGLHMLSMCRHWNGTPGDVSEAFVGTKGQTYSRTGSTRIDGAAPWRSDREQVNPYVQEHSDLIASIRAGKPLNEAQQIAESTLTAIMGREAAYTGKVIEWDALLNADMDLAPPNYEFGPHPVRPIPMPGKKR